jgi:hypothetical protein
MSASGTAATKGRICVEVVMESVLLFGIAFVDADALVAAYGATVTDISAEESPH